MPSERGASFLLQRNVKRWENLSSRGREEWNQFIREYDIYHDGSQVAGYWHGILFVPRSERQRLLEYLSAIRSATQFEYAISLKRLDCSSGRMYRCVRGWLQLGIAALIQNLKGTQYALFTGEDRRIPGYQVLDRVIGLKLVILRIRGGLGTLSLYPDHASKVETTFRIGLKWGLRYFSTAQAKSKVVSLHFDGHEQYGRRIDLDRIRTRIGYLPPEASFAASVKLDDRTSNHTRDGCQEYGDCQLLQLTDLLVGGFRTALGHATSRIHEQLCRPLKTLANDATLGQARMRNSRWNRGYTLREAFIEGDRWQFADIVPALTGDQHELFDQTSSGVD